MASCAVACRQGPAGAAMAHFRGGKSGRARMAGIALGRGWNMRSGLALGADAMAGRTAAGDRRADQRVIEGGACEGRGALMANVAL